MLCVLVCAVLLLEAEPVPAIVTDRYCGMGERQSRIFLLCGEENDQKNRGGIGRKRTEDTVGRPAGMPMQTEPHAAVGVYNGTAWQFGKVIICICDTSPCARIFLAFL